ANYYRKDESVATFKGNEFFCYDLSLTPIQSSTDEITLSFRTQQRNGLMLHTGKSADYVNLSLKRGAVWLVINLGSGAFEALVEPVNGKFNDNAWHDVRVTRNLRQVTISVDGILTTTGYTQEDYTMLGSDDFFYIGGSPNTADLPGSPVSNNFMGCLKDVVGAECSRNLSLSVLCIYAAAEMDLIRALLMSSEPRVQGLNEPAEEGLNSFLNGLNSEQKRKRAGTASRSAGVVLPRNLLLLDHRRLRKRNGAQYPNRLCAVDGVCRERPGPFSLLPLHCGSPILAHCAKTLSNSLYCHCPILDSGKVLGSTVAQSIYIAIKADKNSSLTGDVRGLPDGALPSTVLSLAGPPPVWPYSVDPVYGLVHSTESTIIDHYYHDVSRMADSLSTLGPCPVSNRPETQHSCSQKPLFLTHVTQAGWCPRWRSKTPNPGHVAPSSSLQGALLSSIGKIAPAMPVTAQLVTDAAMTLGQHSGGLCIAWLSAEFLSLFRYLTISLSLPPDCIRIDCNLSKGPETLFAGQKLNDNEWHGVKVVRRGKSLQLSVDNVTVEGTMTGAHTRLEFHNIETGIMTERRFISVVPSNFIGHLQGLSFNGVPYLDQCKNGDISYCELNARFGMRHIIADPVTFRSKGSYLALATLQAYASMHLFFQFKTTASDGLLLFNSGDGSDFIVVELVKGYIHYVFDLGNGPSLMKGNSDKQLNDNQWHNVVVSRDANNVHTLKIDSRTVTQHSNGARNLDLKADGLDSCHTVSVPVPRGPSF
uniref:Laminin G domain-containing protein n=1 Tax=Lepisosteus oculatus TaxID=7918 RepID=W5M3A2_LEPOC